MKTNSLEQIAGDIGKKFKTPEQVEEKIRKNTKWARRSLVTGVLGLGLVLTTLLYGDSKPESINKPQKTEITSRVRKFSEYTPKDKQIGLGFILALSGNLGLHYNLSMKVINTYKRQNMIKK